MGQAPRMSEEEFERLQRNRSAASEHDIQRDLFTWASTQAASCHALSLLYAIPNGQYRPGERPEPGMKSGVPDLHLPVPRTPYLSLYVELKRDDGRLRDEQLKWLRELRGYGHACEVCRGFEDAKTIILDYLNDTYDERPLE